MLLLKLEQTLFLLGFSSANNPVRDCIQTNEVDSNMVEFENLFHSESLFKVASCCERKRLVVSMEKWLDVYAIKSFSIKLDDKGALIFQSTLKKP